MEKARRIIRVRDEDLQDDDEAIGVGTDREGHHTGEVLFGKVRKGGNELYIGGGTVALGFVLYLVLP